MLTAAARAVQVKEAEGAKLKSSLTGSGAGGWGN